MFHTDPPVKPTGVVFSVVKTEPKSDLGPCRYGTDLTWGFELVFCVQPVRWETFFLPGSL